MAGDGRESSLTYTAGYFDSVSAYAGDGRESSLTYTSDQADGCGLLAGDGRESSLTYTGCLAVAAPVRAGDGRESSLTYTMYNLAPFHFLLGMAENHRSRTLIATVTGAPDLLGMAENHRSRTLGQSEPTEKKLVPADRPIKKAEFALVCLQDLVVFFHKTLPSWQIDGQLLPIAAPGPMAEYKL